MAFSSVVQAIPIRRRTRQRICRCSPSADDLPLFSEVVSRSPVELLDVSGAVGIRIEARDPGGDLAGYVNAYKVPGTESANCDAFQVKQQPVKRGMVELNTGRWVWMGFLAALAERKVNVCYGLAIEDEDDQHRKLVKYFERMGAVPVRKVGGRIQDVGDRLVWGGAGLIMEVDVRKLLRRWWRVAMRGEGGR